MRIFFWRILSAFVHFFAILVVIFLLLRFLPGGPFDSEQVLLPEVKIQLESKYQLDEPLIKQLGIYLKHVAQGNWGESYKVPGRKVSQIIYESLPTSFFLGAMALFVAYLVGITFGVLSADKTKVWRSRFLYFFMLVGSSTPTLIAGPLLIYLLSFKLDLLPPALWDGPRYWILPVMALSLRPSCMVFRLIRASVVEKLEEEYITSARARGVPPHQILFRHVLKNSLMPLLGISGSLFAQILSGSFLVELIFSVPGLAHYFVESIGNRDYSVALGITLIYSLVLIVMNFIFHYVAELIDPRLAVTR